VNKIQFRFRSVLLTGLLVANLFPLTPPHAGWTEPKAPNHKDPKVKPVAKPKPRPKKQRLLLPFQERLYLSESSKLPLPEGAQSPLCKFEKKGPKWFVTGLKTGDLEFDWEGTHWTILVRERALRAPSEISLSTFGDYPDLQAVSHWARDFLNSLAELTTEPGALTARGPNLIPYVFDTPMDAASVGPKPSQFPKYKINKEDVVGQRSDGLILSNWPEKIDHDQVLLESPLSGAKQWRVMVHHRNLPDQPTRFLEIELLQPEARAQRYAISSFLAGPSADEIFVGHLAAIRYVKEFGGATPSGYLTSVAGGERHLLERCWIKPGQTVSAMLGIRALMSDKDSGSGTLRVSVRTPGNQEQLQLDPFDRKARTARGIFASESVRELVYSVGPAYLFEEIGAKPYAREMVEDYPSPGNFGMLYRYRWTLDNDSDQTQEVRMELSARGGPARACIWLDGDLTETGLLKAVPILLKRWNVPAHTKLPVLMETFPQAGSNFPISVTLSSKPSAAEQEGASETKAARDWFIP
jgi:hypothetical protein